MGTNFYLVRATDTPECMSCGQNPTAVHVGLSSVGWVFLWHGYRPVDSPYPLDKTRQLADPDEWFAFLAGRCSGSWWLEDQYGEVWEMERFRGWVEAKRAADQRQPLPGSPGGRPDRVVAGGDEVAFYHFS